MVKYVDVTSAFILLLILFNRFELSQLTYKAKDK